MNNSPPIQANADYEAFLKSKRHRGADFGLEPDPTPAQLFDFQRALSEWSIRKGRAAIFADCGLGKTVMELVWCDAFVRSTNKRALIIAPLAVASQTENEGVKFGIECRKSSDGKPAGKITVTNYEKIHLFNPDDFDAVACDEISVLKAMNGKRRAEVTAFMRKTPYRLGATATAAPNDYIELGTNSEALGYLGQMDMLAKFFKNDQNNCATKRLYGEATKWRFKGHAELPFWRWVTSWARACRKPSDLGFDDGPFILPALHEQQHVVQSIEPREGELFNFPAHTLREQREEKKRTIQQRCEVAASKATGIGNDQAILWCQLNEEGDTLERMVPGAVQVSGSDSEGAKEEKLLGFANGDFRVLVTKPKIGAWGLNFQRCNRVIYFPSHSFEQYYQAVRRCWRFGQKRPVFVDLVLVECEQRVMENLRRKAEQAESMFANLVAEMNNAVASERRTAATVQEQIPSWL